MSFGAPSDSSLDNWNGSAYDEAGYAPEYAQDVQNPPQHRPRNRGNAIGNFSSEEYTKQRWPLEEFIVSSNSPKDLKSARKKRTASLTKLVERFEEKSLSGQEMRSNKSQASSSRSQKRHKTENSTYGMYDDEFDDQIGNMVSDTHWRSYGGLMGEEFDDMGEDLRNTEPRKQRRHNSDDKSSRNNQNKHRTQSGGASEKKSRGK